MTNHKEIGTIGESIVITEVLKNGNYVFPEFGDNCKVDLIIMDSAGTLHKIQVKTSNREVNKPDVTLCICISLVQMDTDTHTLKMTLIGLLLLIYKLIK